MSATRRPRPPSGTLTAHVLVEVISIRRHWRRPKVKLRVITRSEETPVDLLGEGDTLEVDLDLDVRDVQPTERSMTA